MNSGGNQSCMSALEIHVGSKDLASILQQALEPETASVPSDRARVDLSRHNSTIIIKIRADDLTALRAAMNSYLAWISGILGAVDSVTSQNP